MGQQLKEPPIIPSSLFAIEPSGQPWQQIRDIGFVGRKRGASVTSPAWFSCFPQGTNVDSSSYNANANANVIGSIATVSDSTKALREALAVLSKNSPAFHTLDCSDNINAKTTIVHDFVTTQPQTRDSGSVTVSSASTGSSTLSGEGDGDGDDSNDEGESDTENEEEVPTASLPPPDALFVVQGADFPCHTQVLLKEALPLYDILSRDGVMERKTKKQRTTNESSTSASTSTSAPTLQPHETQQLQFHQEQAQAWSSPSGITVARLSDGIDSDSFRVIMEYLYTGEIKMQTQEEDEIEGENEDPWLIDGERLVDGNDLFVECDSDAEEFFGDDFSVMELPTAAKKEAEQSPMKFLQGVFVLAEQFGCVSLKQAIENKLYDEFLFAFTAEELHKWAEEHKCGFLKEKAREKLVASKSKVRDENSCKREWKQNLTQDELLLY